ncbi:hypothetical protein ACVOMV_16915 [Mesorhizobium atlanticum]
MLSARWCADIVEDPRIAVDSGLVDAALEVHLLQLLQLSLPADERSAYDAIDNAARAQGLEQTLLQLVERAAARRPLVMIVEDIQWADAETLALIDVRLPQRRGRVRFSS